jgi:hypothetical protein
MKSMLFAIFNMVFIFFTLGCATYQTDMSQTRDLISMGRFEEAESKVAPLAEKEGDSQLVYLLDQGITFQLEKKYKESNLTFLKADKLSEVKDYTSLSRETGAFLLGEEMLQYKGEDFEVVLINAMTAINYLMLGEYDEALVEVRRLNEKLNRFRLEAKRDLGNNSFALYLSALIWEAEGRWDDAYISYEDSYNANPSIPFIGADLIRLSKKSKRLDSYSKWKKIFPEVKEAAWWYDKSYGELVIIYQQGWIPRKSFRPESQRYPKMRSIYSNTVSLEVDVDKASSYKAESVYDVEQVAIKSLEDQYGALVARRVGGVVAKAVMADQIRQKNQLLGDLAWIAMNVSDRADLRQWSTLPASFQFVRIPLKEGLHNISIKGLDRYGSETTDQVLDLNINIKSNQKTFYNYRSLR